MSAFEHLISNIVVIYTHLNTVTFPFFTIIILRDKAFTPHPQIIKKKKKKNLRFRTTTEDNARHSKLWLTTSFCTR
ncbi:hypothetical protein Hanom_Chr17g01549791 [Helianthus anomalus]